MARTHIVKLGECLSKIARSYGFRDYKVIYEHQKNAELRKKRPNPNLLFPGDEVVIPDFKAYEAAISTGTKHTFVVKAQTSHLRLRLLNHAGKPIANEPYVLELKNEDSREKSTDADGKLDEVVLLHHSDAVLRICSRTIRLRFGHLNPVKDVPDEGLSGAHSRLKNIGYAPVHPNADNGRSTRLALAAFQSEEGLQVNGKLDDATLSKLEERHGV